LLPKRLRVQRKMHSITVQLKKLCILYRTYKGLGIYKDRFFAHVLLCHRHEKIYTIDISISYSYTYRYLLILLWMMHCTDCRMIRPRWPENGMWLNQRILRFLGLSFSSTLDPFFGHPFALVSGDKWKATLLWIPVPEMPSCVTACYSTYVVNILYWEWLFQGATNGHIKKISFSVVKISPIKINSIK